MTLLSSRTLALLGRSARPAAAAQRSLKSAASEGAKQSAEPQRPRGGDEEGVSASPLPTATSTGTQELTRRIPCGRWKQADKVAQTDAAFEPSSGPEESARKVESQVRRP